MCSPLADAVLAICEQVRRFLTMRPIRSLTLRRRLGYEEARVGLSNEPTRDRRAAKTLWSLSGKLVRVRRDGSVLLHYRDSLPDDFFPVLILDASGRVRTTYKNWQRFRRNLIVLPTAPKRYDNLIIHHWNHGGGKWAFRTATTELIEGIVATINTEPNKKWLVILHKPEEGGALCQQRIPDLHRRIKDLVRKPENVQVLTWGTERSTNDFSHVENVILAGLLYYPKFAYEARDRASRGIRADQEVDNEFEGSRNWGTHGLYFAGRM